ncbi:MAG TPA: hypothetical protein VFC19_54525 [Candidatus Limnocylindrales bacterium]|nr:hypothetical protein [Candidatus Limnocylindrales bacterium]
MKGLVKLYPLRWRQRYEGELRRLLDDLQPMPWYTRMTTAVDLLRGAIDAHLSMEPTVNPQTRAALRRGTTVGLIVSAVLAAEIVLSNVVFPSTDDNDGLSVLVSYLGIFVALCYTGVLAAKVTTRLRDLALAGAVAGALIGLLAIGTFIVVDNVFIDIVSQQQSKIDGLANSGMTSMRDYINASLRGALIAMTLFLAAAGAGLATVFGTAARHATREPKRPTIN